MTRCSSSQIEWGGGEAIPPGRGTTGAKVRKFEVAWYTWTSANASVCPEKEMLEYVRLENNYGADHGGPSIVLAGL